MPILQYSFDHGNLRINDIMFENRLEFKEWSDLGNETRLHHAAWTGSVDAVQWLLQNGADPMKRTSDKAKTGYLPLDFAIRNEHKEVAELLVQATKNPAQSSDVTSIVHSSVNWTIHLHVQCAYKLRQEEMPTGNNINKVPASVVSMSLYLSTLCTG